MPITPASKINQKQMPEEEIKINGSAETIETPEQESPVEQTVENALEKPVAPIVEKMIEGGGEQYSPRTSAVDDVAQISPVVKSEELKAIENILSEDLGELYKSLPDNRKAEFKKQGEEAATKIEALLSSVKINFNKIVKLIASWLKMIPGINKFFLEQEAKLKADELIALKEKK